MTTNARTVLIPYATDPVSTWTIQSVRGALDSHELGDFAQSARLLDATGRDDRMTACLATRTMAVTSKSGLAFSIEPSEEGPKARNAKLAKEVDSWWFRALPESTQARILRDGLCLGVSISRVDWSRGAESIPNVRPWPMELVSWDESVRQFAVLTTAGRMLVDPDDPNWLVYTPWGYERAWMYGYIRALGLLFVLRQFSYRDWARFSERHGLPIIVIREPSSYPEEDKERFKNEIKSMGSSGVVRLTQVDEGQAGFGIEFLEPRDTSWQSFEAFGKRIDTSIAILLLGQNLTTEVDGGSFAAAKVQDRVRADYLANDTESLSTSFRRELVIPWLAFNHGFPEEQAPWPTWESASPEDKEAIAESFKLSGEAIAALQATKARVDFPALFERLGIPMLPGEPFEEPDLTPPALLPPGAPQAPAEPDPEVPEPPEEDPEPEAASITLASGDDTTDAKGFVNGQTFADKLVAEGTHAAQVAIEPTVDRILDALSGATTFEDARAAILEGYAKSDTRELELLSERILILAQLAGHAAVIEDV